MLPRLSPLEISMSIRSRWAGVAQTNAQKWTGTMATLRTLHRTSPMAPSRDHMKEKSHFTAPRHKPSWDSSGRHVTPTTITPYYDTGDAFREMWDAVDSAKHSITWHTYIFKGDEVGQMTIQKLIAARKRGVDVTLLYDDGGNMTGRASLMEPLRQVGATVHHYKPFLRGCVPYFFGKHDIGMRWHISPGIRNHRKILVVDNRVGFVGGLNVGNEYAGTSVGGSGKFRDTQCKVEGSAAVSHLLEVCRDTLEPIAAARPKLAAHWRRWAGQMFHRRSRKLSRRFRSTVLRRSAGLRSRAAFLHSKWKSFLIYSSPTSKILLRDRLRAVSQNLASRRKVSSGASRIQAHAIRKYEKNFRSGQTFRIRLQRLRNALHQRKKNSKLRKNPELLSKRLNRHLPSMAQILMCNPRTRNWALQMAYWVVVRRAQHRLWVTTPYFLPHRQLVRAVLRAAQSGVDVRIITGAQRTTDPWFMWYAQQYLTHRVLQSGVKLYEYNTKGRVMHAKTVVVDSVWSSIGSYNWDVLSNKLLEVAVTAYDPKLAATMEEHFKRDVVESIEVTEDAFLKRPLYVRCLCRLFYYFVQWLEWFTFRDFADKEISSNIDF